MSSTEEFPKRVFSWVKRGFMIKGALALVTGAFAVDLIFAYHIQRKRERRLRNTFCDGYVQEKDALPTIVVDRPGLISQLVNKFKNPGSRYYLITGVNGTGKSTAVRLACLELMNDKKRKEKGIVYVAVPPDPAELYSSVLPKAFNFNFDEHIGFSAQLMKKILGLPMTPLPRTERTDKKRVEDVILQAAEVYKEKTNKPPVLVIDDINLLPEAAMDELQVWAKKNANNRILTVVFVSSEGKAPRRMQSRSGPWSRGELFEIGDISDAEGKAFLQKQGIQGEIAARLVEKVTGGRLLDLTSSVERLNEGSSYEDILEQAMITASADLRAARLTVEGPLRTYGMKVIERLKQEEIIPMREFEELVPTELEKEELLQKQVFAYHINDTVTFQSRRILTYVNEHLKRK